MQIGIDSLRGAKELSFIDRYICEIWTTVKDHLDSQWRQQGGSSLAIEGNRAVSLPYQVPGLCQIAGRVITRYPRNKRGLYADVLVDTPGSVPLARLFISEIRTTGARVCCSKVQQPGPGHMLTQAGVGDSWQGSVCVRPGALCPG